MAPWSTQITSNFSSIPSNPQLSDFFGPYNKLLSALFPVDTEFTVTPYPSLSSASPSSNSGVPGGLTTSLVFVIFYSTSPVFIVHLHPPSSIRLQSAREDADSSIRRHVRDLRATCPLTTLHAVSAFGTKLGLYRAKAGWPISPERIPAHPELIVDTAPQSRWDCDLMEDDGAIRLKEVVNAIRNQCENL
ncbi:hypothetical protein BDN72DRAFT_838244 [Pluteus cervinus]|uniref:Uncharacterized protein n=1 Tax=Pluteus cervinus TaxID=181527 RepID=A0ACD3AZ94_9AGAR|nr:hypothetical protein BDN72DRAFT_838244 [Pluteus cervinus]